MTNQKHGIDISLLIAVIFLVVFGFVMIYSASSYSAQLQYDDAAYFFKNTNEKWTARNRRHDYNIDFF